MRTLWADTAEAGAALPADGAAAADPALAPLRKRIDGTRLAAHRKADDRTMLIITFYAWKFRKFCSLQEIAQKGRKRKSRNNNKYYYLLL